MKNKQKNILLSSCVTAALLAASSKSIAQDTIIDTDIRIAIIEKNIEKWNNPDNQAIVGEDYRGYLDIFSEGFLKSHRVIAGYNAGSYGEINVQGEESALNVVHRNSYSLFVIGASGTGSINILGGAKVYTDLLTTFGTVDGSLGTATISGTGSSLEIDDRLRIGYMGNGSITVKDNARLTSFYQKL